MRLTHDKRAGAAYLNLTCGAKAAHVAYTEQLSPPVIEPQADTALRLDFDAEGRLLGVEFLVPDEQALPELLAKAESR